MGLSGGVEGKVDADCESGYSITVPKGEKDDWISGVGWMVREGEGSEVGIVEVILHL